MSLVNRTYPDIVRDMLTLLTGGIASEAHPIALDRTRTPVPLPRILLKRRPVARVSVVAGFLAGRTSADEPVPYVFSLNDYELVPSNPADPQSLDTIQFLPFGKAPADGTTLVINYYPRNAEKTVITDVNVGSVARTMLETVGRELGALYAQLNLVHDAAFVETATGTSLDRVVALLGYRRFRAGRPVGLVTFTRRAGEPGEITIPAGTPVTDTQDKIRYETIETHLMRSEESAAQVRVRGTDEGTPVVPPGTLKVIARAVAGLSGVTNERDTTRASDDESDDDLRLRVRGALTAATKGTPEAIRYGLLQMDEVRDVTVTEMPNGVPGEIALAISLAGGGADIPQKVRDRIEQLRPAGIHVITGPATTLTLAADVGLLLAGSSLPTPELAKIEQDVRRTLVETIRAKDIGQPVRVRPLIAALLRDPRIVDVTLTIGPTGALAADDIRVPAGTVLELREDRISYAFEFEDAPAAATTVAMEVSASLAVALIASVTLNDARGVLRSRLESFLTTLRAGETIDAARLLTALRDDSKYQIHPARMVVTIGSVAEAVAIIDGGPSFPVLADQTFTLGDMEVVT